MPALILVTLLIFTFVIGAIYIFSGEDDGS